VGALLVIDQGLCVPLQRSINVWAFGHAVGDEVLEIRRLRLASN